MNTDKAIIFESIYKMICCGISSILMVVGVSFGNDVVKLELQYSDDPNFANWKRIQITGEMVGEDGAIRLPIDQTLNFFRLSIETGENLITPDGFSLVPAGTFTMGRNAGDLDGDAPSVEVYLNSFFISKHEISKTHWDDVRGWALLNGYTDLSLGSSPKGENHPVTEVSWWDAIKWCNARSERDGLPPVYTVNGVIMRTGTANPKANWSNKGYRLPTEAEWEKAARGGVCGQRFPWGFLISHEDANFKNSGLWHYQFGTTGHHPIYDDELQPFTSPIGSFSPNGYGLYDMSGNVWEWCWDWYSSKSYETSVRINPKGPETASRKVGRGGAWFYDEAKARVSDRSIQALPSNKSMLGGFRTAMTVFHPIED